MTSTQDPLHEVLAPQSVLHAPASQTSAVAHFLPQAPQLVLPPAAPQPPRSPPLLPAAPAFLLPQINTPPLPLTAHAPVFPFDAPPPAPPPPGPARHSRADFAAGSAIIRIGIEAQAH